MWKNWSCGWSLVLALVASSARSQEVGIVIWSEAPAAVAPPGCAAPQPGAPVLPAQPGAQPGAAAPGAEAAPAPGQDAFAQAPEAGTGESASFSPNMFGDQGPFITSPSSSSHGELNLHRAAGFIDLVARGAAKITENESPRPQDRLFLTYNYFDNVGPSSRVGDVAQTDVHRETLGFEKTFLDGDASIGLRLPILQVEGDPLIRHEDVGDVSIILKYAFINDHDTGNVLSAGLVVTVPTGDDFLPEGLPDIHPTLLQPFVGAIYNCGDFYVHGFSSIIVPTDDRDVTYWFNDIGVGYWLYRSQEADSVLTAIVPTIELHINTPLNHRGSDSEPIPGIDVVDLTAAMTLGLYQHSTFGLGVVAPLTGPKPFDVEAQAYLNYRF